MEFIVYTRSNVQEDLIRMERYWDYPKSNFYFNKTNKTNACYYILLIDKHRTYARFRKKVAILSNKL